jgi:hypothetical protein
MRVIEDQISRTAGRGEQVPSSTTRCIRELARFSCRECSSRRNAAIRRHASQLRSAREWRNRPRHCPAHLFQSKNGEQAQHGERALPGFGDHHSAERDRIDPHQAVGDEDRGEEGLLRLCLWPRSRRALIGGDRVNKVARSTQLIEVIHGQIATSVAVKRRRAFPSIEHVHRRRRRYLGHTSFKPLEWRHRPSRAECYPKGRPGTSTQVPGTGVVKVQDLLSDLQLRLVEGDRKWLHRRGSRRPGARESKNYKQRYLSHWLLHSREYGAVPEASQCPDSRFHPSLGINACRGLGVSRGGQAVPAARVQPPPRPWLVNLR